MLLSTIHCILYCILCTVYYYYTVYCILYTFVEPVLFWPVLCGTMGNNVIGNMGGTAHWADEQVPLPLLIFCACSHTRMSFFLAGEGVWTCELVDSQAASLRVVDAHGVWRDVCSGEGDPLMDDRARDRRLRARRRGVWSEDISTRRLSKVQKDVMFRPSAALLRRDVFVNVGGGGGGGREVFEDVGGESGNSVGKGRTSAGEQNTRLGTKADLRSPKESGKVGGVFERIQRARRMSMGSIKDWGGKEEAFDLFLRRGWKEAESSPTRVDTAAANLVSPVQTLTGGRRRGLFRSVFTKWRGVRCFEPTMVDS